MVKREQKNSLISEFRKTLRDSLILVWIVTGIILLCLTIIPLILPNETIFHFSSQLKHPHNHNKDCPFCGMTRGYVLMAKGQLKDAFFYNHYAPFLYIGSFVNGAGVIFYLGKLLIR
jgi:hypothetical protein